MKYTGLANVEHEIGAMDLHRPRELTEQNRRAAVYFLFGESVFIASILCLIFHALCLFLHGHSICIHVVFLKLILLFLFLASKDFAQSAYFLATSRSA